MPDPQRRWHRKTLRWRGYDYSSLATYFFTICTYKRDPVLSSVTADGSLHLKPAGNVVHNVWQNLPDRFASVQPVTFMTMPDHVHGILRIGQIYDQDLDNIASSDQPTLSEVIGAFKSIAAINARRTIGDTRKQPFWQRSFNDRVIRLDEELDRLVWYVEGNPIRWANARQDDRFHSW
jgi:putative transposase